MIERKILIGNILIISLLKRTLNISISSVYFFTQISTYNIAFSKVLILLHFLIHFLIFTVPIMSRSLLLFRSHTFVAFCLILVKKKGAVCFRIVKKF